MRIPIILALAFSLADACSASGSSAPNDDVKQPEVAEPAPEPQPEPQPQPQPEPEAGLDDALTLPHDVPPLDSPCKTRREFAQGRVESALSFASNGCTNDAECVKAAQSTGCRGACPTAVLATHAEAYESFRTSLDERVCSTYQGDKCPYATPRCISGAPACVEGRCAWVGP